MTPTEELFWVGFVGIASVAATFGFLRWWQLAPTWAGEPFPARPPGSRPPSPVVPVLLSLLAGGALVVGVWIGTEELVGTHAARFQAKAFLAGCLVPVMVVPAWLWQDHRVQRAADRATPPSDTSG